MTIDSQEREVSEATPLEAKRYDPGVVASGLGPSLSSRGVGDENDLQVARPFDAAAGEHRRWSAATGDAGPGSSAAVSAGTIAITGRPA